MRRRSLLTLGAVSAAALALGGGTLALLKPGLQEAKLSNAGRDVFAGVSRALLDGSLPTGAQDLASALDALLARIEGVVSALAPHAQSELSQLLALLASGGGRRALAGLSEPWQTASVPDIERALQGMRVSSISLRQQAYQALHDIVGGAYFSEAQTWGMLGYPGPLKI
jgi:hypothetical protein